MGRFYKLFSMLVFFAFSACTTNSPNTPDNSNDTPPEIPNITALTIAIPQNAPTDIQAMVVAANSLTGLGYAYLNAVTDTQPVQNDGKWTWTYNNGSLTIILIAVMNADNTVSWELILDGKEAVTSTDFTNWMGQAAHGCCIISIPLKLPATRPGKLMFRVMLPSN
ncbi:MAG: hypothetical protein ACE5I1_03500 [bacterium]